MNEKEVSTVKFAQMRVWDIPVRLFHWSLVLAVAFLWYSGEVADDLERHMQIGTLVLALLLFRVVWGVVGSTTARFTHFIRPAKAIKHLKELRAQDLQPEAGHNPLGGLMVVALLLVLLTQAVSGLFTSDEVLSDGPLYASASTELTDLMGKVHHINFTILQILVAMHVLAIVFYVVVKKTNLVKPMITGVMAWPVALAQPKLMFRSWLLAVVLFVPVFLGVRYALS